MSEPEEQAVAKEPQVGDAFYVSSEDEGEADEQQEIEEVCEHNVDEGTWNVAAGGDFYDIKWNDSSSRWEEE